MIITIALLGATAGSLAWAVRAARSWGPDA